MSFVFVRHFETSCRAIAHLSTSIVGIIMKLSSYCYCFHFIFFFIFTDSKNAIARDRRGAVAVDFVMIQDFV